MLADLRHLAASMGLASGPTALQQARLFTGGLLAQLTGKPPLPPARDIKVPDGAAMLVELRRRLARAHQLAVAQAANPRSVASAWTAFHHAFGPRWAAPTVQQHKDVVARFDESRRRVADATARGVDSLTGQQRYELLCEQQRLELLAELVEQIAALYDVRVVAEDLA